MNKIIKIKCCKDCGFFHNWYRGKYQRYAKNNYCSKLDICINLKDIDKIDENCPLEDYQGKLKNFLEALQYNKIEELLKKDKEFFTEIGKVAAARTIELINK